MVRHTNCWKTHNPVWYQVFRRWTMDKSQFPLEEKHCITIYLVSSNISKWNLCSVCWRKWDLAYTHSVGHWVEIRNRYGFWGSSSNWGDVWRMLSGELSPVPNYSTLNPFTLMSFARLEEKMSTIRATLNIYIVWQTVCVDRMFKIVLRILWTLSQIWFATLFESFSLRFVFLLLSIQHNTPCYVMRARNILRYKNK